MEIVLSISITVLSSIIVGCITWFAGKAQGFRDEHKKMLNAERDFSQIKDELSEVLAIKDDVKQLLEDFEVIKSSQRNQIKEKIVDIYQRATSRGYITPLELDTLNRLADSYFDLDGNHYIHAIVARANNDMKIVGESLPS